MPQAELGIDWRAERAGGTILCATLNYYVYCFSNRLLISLLILCNTVALYVFYLEFKMYDGVKY